MTSKNDGTGTGTNTTSNNNDDSIDWNERGVNKKYLDTRKKFKPEEIEESNKAADYWHNTVGAEVIPIYSAKRSFSIIKTYAQYRIEPVPTDEYNYWKELGLFTHGIIVLTGLLRRGEYKGKYLNCVDFDNKKGKELVLGMTLKKNGKAMTLEETAQNTVVEVYGDPNRAHVYFITETRPMVSKESDVNKTNDADKVDYDKIPLVEVHSLNSQMICTNSYKTIRGTNDSIARCSIIGTDKPLVLDAKKTDQLEKALDERLAEFGLSYLDKVKGSKSQTPIEDLFKEGYKVYEGDRQSKFLRICGWWPSISGK